MSGSGQSVQNSVVRDPARHDSPRLTELLACRDTAPHHSPFSLRGPPRGAPELWVLRAQQSPRAPGTPQWRCSPTPCTPVIPGTPAQVLSVLLEAPSSAPAWLSGIPHLQLPGKERGPGLAAQPGGVSQMRGPAPNPSCRVLQGSEQLIMNLIKREQEPQSDLGFLLDITLLRWRGWGSKHAPSARAAGVGVGGQQGSPPSPAVPALCYLGWIPAWSCSSVRGSLSVSLL